VFDAVRVAAEEALDRGGLEALGARVAPTVLAKQQERLPVLPALEPLLPGAGLRRGTTVGVAADPGAGGATSLALALAVAASAAGSWVAAVGLPSLGLVAADELGVALERLVLVARPERDTWGGVVAALVDGFDLLLVQPGHPGVRAVDARRLVARARERGAVLVAIGPGWPEAPEITLRVRAAEWQGIDAGHGHLQARRVTVARSGRGEAARPVEAELWLPDAEGLVTPAPPTVDRARPLRRLRSVS
jgi:hypothetical protein